MSLQERFINKLKDKYGDIYDYSKVVYISPKRKVKLICKKHNLLWEADASHILSGQECPECTKEKIRERLKNNFIKKAKDIHGDKYDYSKVEYINERTPVTIISSDGEEFEIKPANFLRDSKEKNKRKALRDEFIRFVSKADEIHKGKYTYDESTFVRYNKEMKIICPEHGSFWQKPSNHIRGQGCRKCQIASLTSNKDEFIEKARKIHGIKYDYSKVEYKKANIKVCIICPEHGEFWQSPNNHLMGKGCPYCAGKYKTTNSIKKEFIKIHGIKYDYSKVVYEKAIKKVCIICPEHGEFWMAPNKHLAGENCPRCNASKLEEEIEKLLVELNASFKRNFRALWLKKQHLDFFIPDINVAIECQGIQHFEPLNVYGGEEGLKVNQERDHRKYILCKNNGVKIIYYANNDRFIAPDELFGEKVYIDKQQIRDILLKSLNK